MAQSATSVIRETNERMALDLLLTQGPISKTRLGELAGVSKVTAGQMLARLERRGLVEVVGTQPGGRRGPNAELFALVPSSGYVAALHIGPDVITGSAADITGTELARFSVDPHESSDPVAAVRQATAQAAERAGFSMSQLSCLSIGTPGMVDSRTGDVRFGFDLPDWHNGVLTDIRQNFGRPVLIENDVNLAGLAERKAAAAHGVRCFVLAWIDRGLGMAVVIDGKVLRGADGCSGEIGYLPVPGAPLPSRSKDPRRTSFQSLVGAEAVRKLAREHRMRGGAGECIRKAIEGHPQGDAFLDELAHRLALGLAGVYLVLDPELCVLSGEIGNAGGKELARRVEAAIEEMCPNRPRVVPSELSEDAVLLGALEKGLEVARDEVFAGH
ncbi:ROK family transcriptional regulator [Luteipulveratus mongoliensis]|uniref:ROK family transcriptional regulator n=1 Tax=Luteipulveratus mongoliensis TaxID=571913 RepID=A0A0K1JE89_9MICO|nr:ROK family transcriptional regulator [Luteipulveratus mongoliensis]AKU14908.1 ROK family transcriptional regulator [Luteipulveratus mongoliensis]